MQVGHLPPTGTSSSTVEGREGRHHAAVEKEVGFGEQRVTFFKCAFSSIFKYKHWMSSLSTHLPALLARKTHLWCQTCFPSWCSTNALSEVCNPYAGYIWPLKNAALLAHDINACCQSLSLQPSDQLLAVILIWLSHPGHKWFIKATKDSHKPHSLSETSHASINKCHDSGCGDTVRTSDLGHPRDSSSLH